MHSLRKIESQEQGYGEMATTLLGYTLRKLFFDVFVTVLIVSLPNTGMVKDMREGRVKGQQNRVQEGWTW